MANRAQRRLFNKKNKTNYSKSEFEMMLALERIKNGNFNLSDLDVPKDFIHMDNEELAPEGTLVRLNYERIQERFRRGGVDETNLAFRTWIEENKDKEFHLTREGTSQSLVALQEDEREVELDGVKHKAPKWLFDLYSDLLLKDESDGQWKMLSQIDPKMKEYFETNIKPVVDNNREQNK